MIAQVIAASEGNESFLVQLIQQLVLALGVALAGGNALALFVNQRSWHRYEAGLAQYKRTRKLKDKSKRSPKPAEPRLVRTGPAVLNIVIGLTIALVALASLTFDWIG